MRVLVTGANSFIGRHLVRRLVREDAALGKPVNHLVLIDQRFDEAKPRRGYPPRR